MRLTKEEDYIFRIIRTIGKSTKIVSANEIAKQENITVAEVLKILRRLKEKGIVESKRGLEGGYRLTIDLKENTIGSLLAKLGKPMYINECINTKEVICPNNSKGQCNIHKKLLHIQNVIYQELNKDSLYELMCCEEQL